MAKLLVLGGLDLTGVDGRPLRSVLTHPKSSAVLAFLALAAPGRALSRDRLLSVFWPESDQSRARNALSQVLHGLRHGLGEDVIVNRGNNSLWVDPDRLWCDVIAFIRAVENGEQTKALGLYSGHFLEGFHLSGGVDFETWVAEERGRLKELAARSAWDVAHGHIQEGRLTDAERTGQRALDWVCTDENEVRRFISALAEAGDRAAAVSFYERFVARLHRELELSPDPATQAVIGTIRRRREGAGTDLPEDDRRPSIAALPWTNRSGREEDRYFTDGIHEEILGRLSTIGGLRVIARPSVMRFRDTDQAAPEIAADLGVRYLLDAGLIRAQDRVRINVQLTDARANQVLWGQTYEHVLSMGNLLSVQGHIARRVAGELQAVLTPEEEARLQTPVTGNLEAYELYLLGRHRWVIRSSETLRRAIQYHEAAIEKDAGFALAWAGLADAWTALPWYEHIPALEAYARARDAASRALQLDEGLAEVHAALGGLALYYEWEWDRAEGHLLRALDLNPNYAQAYHWLSMVQGILGRSDDAIESILRGISLNPMGNNFHGTLAQLLYSAGRFGEARNVFRTMEKFDPPIPTDLLCMSLFLSRQGPEEEAFRVVRRWGKVIGYPKADRLPLVLKAFNAPELTQDALAVLEDVRRVTGLQAGFLACFCLNLHAPSEALRVLQEAIVQRHAVVPFLGITAYFPQYATDPEILAALQGAGIPIR